MSEALGQLPTTEAWKGFLENDDNDDAGALFVLCALCSVNFNTAALKAYYHLHFRDAEVQAEDFIRLKAPGGKGRLREGCLSLSSDAEGQSFCLLVIYQGIQWDLLSYLYYFLSEILHLVAWMDCHLLV